MSQIASKTCRICLENDNPTDLISPCLCTSGSEYVHRECLDSWRSVNTNGVAFKMCEVCQFEYIIEPMVDDPSADRKRLLTFRLLVTRDITLIILLLQAIIIGMTFLLQVVDKKNHVLKNLYPASMNSFGTYCLSSLILCFALLGIFGLIAACCGMITDDDLNDRCNCPCYACFFLRPACHGCDGNNNCSGGGEGGGCCVVVLVVIVVTLSILGVFVGIILSWILIRQILKRHTNKLWLKQETKKYIVKDFQGRRNQLPTRLPRQPIPKSFIRKGMDNDRTKKKQSAPVELLPINADSTV